MQYTMPPKKKTTPVIPRVLVDPGAAAPTSRKRRRAGALAPRALLGAQIQTLFSFMRIRLVWTILTHYAPH